MKQSISLLSILATFAFSTIAGTTAFAAPLNDDLTLTTVQPAELTGSALPSELRDYVGDGHGDYINGKISGGYYVAEFVSMDTLQNTRVSKRNNIENLLSASDKAGPRAHNTILDNKFDQEASAFDMNREFIKAARRSKQISSTYSMDAYVSHSDGSVEWFMDGMLKRVDNQKTVNELGQVSTRNLYNFTYKRGMMTGYEADETDSLGNKKHIKTSYNYTDDSIWYADATTNAIKHYTEWTQEETDLATGRTTSVHWQANKYDGRFLTDYTQTVTDSEYGTQITHQYDITYWDNQHKKSYTEEGLSYHDPAKLKSGVKYDYKIERDLISYTETDQVKSYSETRWDINPLMAKDGDDGIEWSDDLTQWVKTESTVSISYANMKFFDRDVSESARILSQNVISKTSNPDGSWRTENTTTEYGYNGATGKLSSMKTYSTAEGANPDWIEYTDKSGNQLKTRTSADGAKEYYYADPDTNKEVIVAEDDVTKTEKAGAGYKENTTTTYAIYNDDTPLPEATTSVIEMYEADSTAVAHVTTRDISYTNELIDRSENGLNNKHYRTTASTENRETWSKILDPDKKYLTTRITTTTNTFDDKGLLKDVSGSATETGWEYSASTGFCRQYKSTAAMEYEVVLGKALLKDTKETWTYIKSDSSESTSPDTSKKTSSKDTKETRTYIKSDSSKSASSDTSKKIDFGSYTDSASLMSKAWEYYNNKDYDNAAEFARELINRYENKAEEQQKSLEAYAASGKESDYWALNDVGTAYYVLGQIYKHQADKETDAGKKDGLIDKAKENLNIVINTLGFAQCWDTKGWYWKVAEGASKLLNTL